MKILFLGDYSSVHAYLAQQLRKQGHSVTLVTSSINDSFSPHDILLKREAGPWGSFSYLYKIFSILPQLKGYDVVQFINPTFFTLKAGKLNYLLRDLKKNNGSLFLTLAGNDSFFVKACCEGELFRFSEFRIGNAKTDMVNFDPEREYGWLIKEMMEYSKIFYENLDGAVSMLPEYHFAAETILQSKLDYIGLPINLDHFDYKPLEVNNKLKFLVGMRSGMEIQKGTLRLLSLLKDVEKKFPDKCEVINVKDLPLSDYLKIMKDSHIVVDQLYSYSPAMNALDAMALGRVAASGAQPEFYQFINETELRPVICLDPIRNDIEEEFISYVNDPSPLFEKSIQGRKLVEKHNDVKIVASKLENHWNKILAKK